MIENLIDSKLQFGDDLKRIASKPKDVQLEKIYKSFRTVKTLPKTNENLQPKLKLVVINQ